MSPKLVLDGLVMLISHQVWMCVCRVLCYRLVTHPKCISTSSSLQAWVFLGWALDPLPSWQVVTEEWMNWWMFILVFSIFLSFLLPVFLVFQGLLQRFIVLLIPQSIRKPGLSLKDYIHVNTEMVVGHKKKTIFCNWPSQCLDLNPVKTCGLNWSEKSHAQT